MKEKHSAEQSDFDDEDNLPDDNSSCDETMSSGSPEEKKKIDVRRQLEALLEEKRLRKENNDSYDFDLDD